MTMWLRGATLVAGPRAAVDIEITGDRISAVAPADRRDGRTLDSRGLVVSPGFVDLQLNGSFGIDLATEPERVGELAAALPPTGVTAFLPTLVSCPGDQVRRALAVDIDDAHRSPGSRPLGWHLEGPYLAPARGGAHALGDIRPVDAAELAGWLATGHVAAMTLAPERRDALEAIGMLCRSGALAAVGHTDATAPQMVAAADAGARLVTHLFNAMSPFHHRAPGPVGATLADERWSASLVVDDVHLDPVTVAAVWGGLGSQRTVLVTDAVAAAGTAPGSYQLGRRTVTSAEGRVVDERGALAGSTLSLDVALRNLVAATGCPIADALATVTSTPRRLLGLEPGSVAVGALADLVLLDDTLHVVGTLVGGRLLHDRDGRWT